LGSLVCARCLAIILYLIKREGTNGEHDRDDEEIEPVPESFPFESRYWVLAKS
jgi:hypothetical protein